MLAESCVRDYSRLRAGDGADALFADAGFRRRARQGRWEAYPRALAMVGERSRRRAASATPATTRTRCCSGLIALIARCISTGGRCRRAIGDVEWRAARGRPRRSLNDLVRAPPKTAEAVARDHSSYYLAIMPLHPKLGGDNFAALRSQLKLALLQIQEAFGQRANLPALANELAGRVPKVEAARSTLRPGVSGRSGRAYAACVGVI